MLSSLNSVSQSFVSAMNNIGKQLARVQGEVATGVKVANVSDAPDSVSAILQTRAHLSALDQIQTNLSLVKAETDTGEQSLASAVDLVQQVRTLGAEGITGTATADSRTALATQVGTIMQQLVGLADTNINGRYLFSGDKDQQAPYTMDVAQNLISEYDGGTDTRQVQHPNGTLFGTSLTAQQIFEATDPTQNVFSSLSALRTALANNDQAGINAALPNVGTSLSYLNVQLSFYGDVQNKVTAATDYGDTLKVQLKSQLSTLQDADMTESITELSQLQLAQTAALQVRAKIPNTSLFDYMG